MNTIETTQRPPAKLASTYKMGFLVLLSVEILWDLFDAKSDPSIAHAGPGVLLVYVLTQVFATNVLFLLIASAISVVGIFMTQGSRLILLARVYFFVMAILTPLFIMSELFRRMYIEL